ncbi:MAG TPA: site-2 protease family protein [Terriglobales bacterium]|jgi:Zn-dependent protease/CBS domain-containing protein|nr:site-2 protease family protein [Terriglobales bacterium]
MRSWSIPAGRIFGVELRIHWTFFLLPLFVWYTEYASHGTANGERDFALVAIMLACVLAHELGHALIANRSGLRAKFIILLPIGGITQMDDSQPPVDTNLASWKRDIRIALAGPLTNLLIAVVAGAILLAFVPQASLWTWPFVHSSNLLRSLVWVNLYLAGFNLLPAYPMDGGRVLRALFSRHMEPIHATRRAVSIGQAFATLFILVGMLLPNYWLTLVGLFLFIASQIEERSVVFQSVLERVRLEDVMLTDFATLSPADTLEDALDKAVHSLQDDFPVIRGSDMVGVISRQKILEALRVEGNGYVQAVMNRIFEVAQKGESLASAFRKLTAKNLSIIPVVEDQRLVGIVTLQNLMHSMALLAESRKLRKQALNS